MEVSSEKDLFGNLPDEILGSIVSFLPNETSLETTLISTRWRDLWNKILVKHGTLEDITDSVSEFLSLFDELDPLKHPRKLRFHYAEDNDERSASLFAATIATNNKLLLDFSSHDNKNQRERHYDLQFMFQNVVPSSSFLVKTLHLKSVTCLTSEVASSIVSNLDHLENLVISECHGLKCLCIESDSKLRKLTILDCLQLMYLHLRTSKLKSLRFHGTLPRIWPQSHFNLSDATLDFRLGPSSNDLSAQNFDETLLTIKNSEVLTLCEWTFEALIWPSISPSSGNFIFYKLRELWWIDSHKDENDALTSFLKLCPALEQLYVTIDPKSYKYSGPGSNSGLMKSTKKTLVLQNLKLIKLMGFASEVDEISVAKKLIKMVKPGKSPKIETSDGSCLVFMQ